MNMSPTKHDNGPKVIQSRSVQESNRPQRLGIVEEQQQSSTHLNVLNVFGCLNLAMWFQIAVKAEEKQSKLL